LAVRTKSLDAALASPLPALLKKIVYDRAFGRIAPLAAGGGLGKRPLHPAQIGNLAPDIAQVRKRGILDLAAGVPALDQAEKIADFIEGETEFAAAPDEHDPPQVVIRVEAVSPLRSRRRRQNPDLLVIADRLDVDAAPPRQLANSKALIFRQKKPLASVVTTESILKI
jgi:hypothetical protein